MRIETVVVVPTRAGIPLARYTLEVSDFPENMTLGQIGTFLKNAELRFQKKARSYIIQIRGMVFIATKEKNTIRVYDIFGDYDGKISEQPQAGS